MAATTTRLLLVRHGETHWNAGGRLQGQLDTELNDTGRAQAAAAAAWLAARHGGARGEHPPLAAVYSSDLRRAADTAAAIAAAVGGGLRVVLDARLRETHLGAWQGLTWDAVLAAHREHVVAWKTDPDAAAPGGGESVRARFHRVAAALHEIALAHPGGTVAVVAHGGVLDDAGRLALGVPFSAPTQLRKANTCICDLAVAIDDVGALADAHAALAAGGGAGGSDGCGGGGGGGIEAGDSGSRGGGSVRGSGPGGCGRHLCGPDGSSAADAAALATAAAITHAVFCAPPGRRDGGSDGGAGGGGGESVDSGGGGGGGGGAAAMAAATSTATPTATPSTACGAATIDPAAARAALGRWSVVQWGSLAHLVTRDGAAIPVTHHRHTIGASVADDAGGAADAAAGGVPRVAAADDAGQGAAGAAAASAAAAAGPAALDVCHDEAPPGGPAGGP